MTDNRTTELLPCPFCGGEYTQVRWIGFKDKGNGAFDAGYRGECCDCGALTRAYDTEAEAIAAWNARTTRKVIMNVKFTAEQLDEIKEHCLERLGVEEQSAHDDKAERLERLAIDMYDMLNCLFDTKLPPMKSTLTEYRRRLGKIGVIV